MGKEKKHVTKRNPWAWIPTLYFAQGLPYVAVMTISVIMYKKLGMSNANIALYTGWLGLPWVIKPFWSPFVDIIRTKRWWTLIMQWVVAFALAGIAFTIPTSWWVQLTFAVFMIMGFASATHDIAADGFYMLALNEHEQSMFVGIRSTFYRIATVFGQGLLVILAGLIEMNSGLTPVNFEVTADTSKEVTIPSIPQFDENQIVEGNDPYFVTTGDKISMSVLTAKDVIGSDTTTNMAFADYSKMLKDSVEHMNIANGFYKPEPAFVGGDEITMNDSNSVLGVDSYEWETDHYVYKCLDDKGNVVIVTDKDAKKEKKKEGGLLRSFFAALGGLLDGVLPDKDRTKTSNVDVNENIAIVAIKLSQEPKADKEYVFCLSNNGGSSDISSSVERAVFNKSNWDKPLYVVFTANSRIKEKTESSFKGTSGNIPLAWMIVFITLSIFFLLVVIYHTWILPKPKTDEMREKKTAKEIAHGFVDTFKTFFTKFPVWQTVAAILFMLFYRFPEAQLTKMIMPFLVDPIDKGGLALTTGQVGLVYGTVGIIGLTVGGIIGGLVAAKGGLKRWLQPMAWSMSLTCLVFIYLSIANNPSLLTINICVFIEQFGYGFGFTAYMLYLIYYSEGKYKTAHYAICTGFMALSMMLGMISGIAQEVMGYYHFFIWTMICCAFTIIVAMLVKVDPKFGLKKEDEEALVTNEDKKES